MQFMAAEHSWDKRVDTYVDLFRKILSADASALYANEDPDRNLLSKE